MLTIDIRDERPLTRTVALEGRLDSATAAELDERLEPILASDVRTLVLDLSKLDFISSAGLASVFRAQKRMTDRGGTMLMVELQPQVKRVFEIVKMVHLPTVFQSRKELDDYLEAIQNKTGSDD
jgi:anti-anti-sigma factor